MDLNRLRSAEPDAALGNGGLGRLAACFMESMASLGIPAYGYGIRYDHGLFRQVIRNGWQQEYPEEWLSFGNPWEFARPEVTYDIHFGGFVETAHLPGGARAVGVASRRDHRGGRLRHADRRMARPAREPVAAVDRPARSIRCGSTPSTAAITSARWSSRSRAEAISKILYPSDDTPAGRELRLRQEYFFVSASLQDLVQRHLRTDGDLHFLPMRAAIQLNDTHPSIAIPELMRLLVDVHGLPWSDAWLITIGTFSYTNHTLLPEALESWPMDLFERVLPRHLQIIYRINAEHLEGAQQQDPVDLSERIASISLIDEHERPQAAHGTSRVRRLAPRERRLRAPHRADAQDRVPRSARALSRSHRQQDQRHHLSPLAHAGKSGPRAGAARGLRRRGAGRSVARSPRLAEGADDSALHERVAAAKRANKVALSRLVGDRMGLRLDPDALFDVQIKRIHEYKRQLLNILETVALYRAIRDDPTRDWVPRVKIFAGKAAASYAQAKLIIKLINDVAKVVNDDPRDARSACGSCSCPTTTCSLAEVIIPAADLSEQISTAGMEASGTGNMKLALNGALTIGTLDGANIEIREHVGADNIFIFGLEAHEVEERAPPGPRAQPRSRRRRCSAGVVDAIEAGIYWPGEGGWFAPLMNGLRHDDHYMVAADFDAYFATQRRIDELWRSPSDWTRDVHHEYRQHGVVLLRPCHRRVRAGHLAGALSPCPPTREGSVPS